MITGLKAEDSNPDVYFQSLHSIWYVALNCYLESLRYPWQVPGSGLSCLSQWATVVSFPIWVPLLIAQSLTDHILALAREHFPCLSIQSLGNVPSYGVLETLVLLKVRKKESCLRHFLYWQPFLFIHCKSHFFHLFPFSNCLALDAYFLFPLENMNWVENNPGLHILFFLSSSSFSLSKPTVGSLRIFRTWETECPVQ